MLVESGAVGAAGTRAAEARARRAAGGGGVVPAGGRTRSDVTADVSHVAKGWLNELAPQKVACGDGHARGGGRGGGRSTPE